MTAFLFLVVVLLAIWIARGASRARRNERLISQLTSRIYNLEQEIKRVRTPATEPTPLPIVVPAPAVEPAARQIFEPEPVLESKPGPQRIETPILEPQPVPARDFSFSELLDFEETFGTNWLNKLGIVILVIGVALFLGYEMRTLGAAGKVLTGYLVAGAMLGAGVFFERREQWRILARAGIAGGWALVYFTTYAMNHVAAAQVLPSESADLVLMLAVAAAMVAHTLRYASQTVSGLAFLLAFTTINLSRGSAASLLASAILAAALAAVAVRRRWFEMELAGMAAAYVNHYLWLRPVIEPMHGHVHAFPGYVASAALLYAYWLIFRASYVLRTVPDRRGEIISTIAALLNVGLFGWVMGYQSVHPELAFQFFLLIGAVEFSVGQLPITRRRRPAFIVLTTLGASLLVMAFPFRYSGDNLSSSWLAISECLLVAGVLLREIVFRRLGLAVALVAWVHMMVWDAAPVWSERARQTIAKGRLGLALLFGLAAFLFYVNSQYLPRRWPEVIHREVDCWCFRQLAHLACGLALVSAWLAWPGPWTAVAWAALTFALLYAVRRWDTRELAVEAVVCAGATILRVLFVNQYADAAVLHTPWLSERLLTMALVIALFYLSSRWVSGLSAVAARRISAGYTWAASILAGFLCWYELEPVAVGLGWSLAALILFEIGQRRDWQDLRFQAYAGFAASFLRIFVVNLNAIDSGAISARVYSIVPLVVAFYYVYARLSGAAADSLATERRFKIAQSHCLFGTLATAALVRFELDADLVVVGWAALVWIFVFVTRKTGRRIFLDHAMIISFAALARCIFHNIYERSYFPAPFGHGRIATVGITILLLLVTLPFARKLRLEVGEKHRNWLLNVWSALERSPHQVFFFLPFGLLTVLLAEMPSGLVTLAWGVEAFAVFALAIWLKERSYRLSALGLVLLCVAKILVRDVWGLAPRDRYLTFIVLGSALLAISYLYTRYRDVLRQYL